MRRVYILLFFSIFSIIVQANDFYSLPNIDEPFQYPNNCLKSSIKCVLKTDENHKWKWQLGKAQITLMNDTTVLRQENGSFVLISGRVFVEKGNDLLWKSEFGSLLEGGELYLLEHIPKSFKVYSLRGTLKFQPLGAGGALNIYEGFTNEFSGIGARGEGVGHLPKPWEFKKIVEKWGRGYSRSKIAFKKDVKDLYRVWEVAVEMASNYYEKTLRRGLASYNKRHEEKLEKRRKRQKADRKLRELFRKRNFFNQQ